jgi:hypothetical protein
MTQLIFKTDLEQSKLDALLHFLKSWNIDAEIKTSTTPKIKKQVDFSLASGIWKDANIDAKSLRDKAWSRQ